VIERTLQRSRVDEQVVRYAVRVAGDECAPNTTESNHHQAAIVAMLAEQPATFYCGPSRWQRASAYHDGRRWVVEVYADVREPDAEGA
jgi:hypothetical protein